MTSFSALHCATFPTGEITIDTTWKAKQSPFILESSIRVKEGRTLRVEAGVEIWCEEGVAILNEGRIELNGTREQMIFVRARTPVDLTGNPHWEDNGEFEGSWDGFVGISGFSPTFDFSYARISGAAKAIDRFQSTVTMSLRFCEFIDNGIALARSDWGNGPTEVTDCYFEGNFYGIESAAGFGVLKRCVFIENSNAVRSVYNTISHCYFERNRTALAFLRNTVEDCLFVDNERAVTLMGTGPDVRDCRFEGNDYDIMLTGGADLGLEIARNDFLGAKVRIFDTFSDGRSDGDWTFVGNYFAPEIDLAEAYLDSEDGEFYPTITLSSNAEQPLYTGPEFITLSLTPNSLVLPRSAEYFEIGSSFYEPSEGNTHSWTLESAPAGNRVRLVANSGPDHVAGMSNLTVDGFYEISTRVSSDTTFSARARATISFGDEDLRGLFYTANNATWGTASGPDRGAIGESVVVSATASPGYRFVKWDGDYQGSDNPANVVVNGIMTFQAEFARDQNDDDDDGLTNYQELVIYNTKPDNPDSDQDQIKDGDEIVLGFDPNVGDYAKIALIQSLRSTFQLYDADDLENHFGGRIVVHSELTEDGSLRLWLKQSADLEHWSDDGEPVVLPLEANNKALFYRVDMHPTAE
jgi:hypothetical protein